RKVDSEEVGSAGVLRKFLREGRTGHNQNKCRHQASPAHEYSSKTAYVRTKYCQKRKFGASNLGAEEGGVRNANIPLLCEEGWRDSLIEAGAPGAKREPVRAKPQLVVSSAKHSGLTTPSELSLRSAHPPLRCEEGNVYRKKRPVLAGLPRKKSSMEPLRFIHAADLHLDSPFRGIAEASAGLRGQLQSATLAALSRVVDHTIYSKADFLIIAGDIYDSKDRNLRALVSFRKEMERLAERNVPVYIVHGNHDPLNGWGSGFQLPPNVITFGGRVDTEPYIRRGREAAEI